MRDGDMPDDEGTQVAAHGGDAVGQRAHATSSGIVVQTGGDATIRLEHGLPDAHIRLVHTQAETIEAQRQLIAVTNELNEARRKLIESVQVEHRTSQLIVVLHVVLVRLSALISHLTGERDRFLAEAATHRAELETTHRRLADAEHERGRAEGQLDQAKRERSRATTVAEAAHARIRSLELRLRGIGGHGDAHATGDPELDVPALSPDDVLRDTANGLDRVQQLLDAQDHELASLEADVEPPVLDPGTGDPLTGLSSVDLRDAQARMNRSGRRFADLVSLTPVGVGLFDESERLVDANDALCDLLGIGLEQLRGATAAELTHPDDSRDWLLSAAEAIGKSESLHTHEIPQRILVRRDGALVYCELRIALSVQDDGRRFWLVVFQDITERRRTAQALRHQATYDELTGLPNRALVKEMLGGLLESPERSKVAVLFCDIDNFKRVNDSLGHDAGDELLVALARRLEGGLPEGCTAARLSGDEYVIICENIDRAGGVDALATRVAGLLRTAVPVHGQLVRVSASIGVAVPNGSRATGNDLLRFADAAMFEAKRSGAGRVSLASAALIESADRQVHLEGQLREALQHDGLTLHFQPVVGVDGVVQTAEALVRWPHPDRGLLPRDVFLPVAEQGDLLRELDRWVLRTALKEASTWPEPGGRPVSVAVNLAGLVPGDPEFVDIVANAIAEAGIPWDRVVLELVETALLHLPSRVRRSMDELVGRGIRFAVDDFATGYSSLARLKDLPAQIIKVDRRFVSGLGTDTSDFAVTKAVVDIARAMGRTCVAEDVETATQFQVLRGLGVDAYQGWLFSRPLPPAEFRALLALGKLAVPGS
ncbi:putative bifunctional diguanylate cyclase/phosphodiesterase [Saccharothrix luteola]|uniref:putative bifunctional diguanylate cyclase/phosphodiesterase n=1 Tax=Saccharothrix luteola TaxID=2893018 RepID=UPI001E652EF8|nr:EAL domain-containing protein [Saccharothrix luteola]MCC8251503.1 EAL domain-containing protein [Saccharothrix luteola]